MVFLHGGSLKNTLTVLLMENVNQGNSAIFMFRILIIKGVKNINTSHKQTTKHYLIPEFRTFEL